MLESLILQNDQCMTLKKEFRRNSQQIFIVFYGSMKVRKEEYIFVLKEIACESILEVKLTLRKRIL